jgi:hypothetical protein
MDRQSVLLHSPSHCALVSYAEVFQANAKHKHKRQSLSILIMLNNLQAYQSSLMTDIPQIALILLLQDGTYITIHYHSHRRDVSKLFLQMLNSLSPLSHAGSL